ncbi:MAG TPA: hypothetical protein VJN65_04930, partial [Bacteroidota bacterium]|nr:hypothetical protein [Bacteroidota bacterium]
MNRTISFLHPLLAVFFLWISPAFSFQEEKTESSLTPSPRYSFALAFDEGRGRLILFGGFANSSVLGDTWEWDGMRWEKKSETGPSARNSPAMVYDNKRKSIILFGGDAGNRAFGDTWEWKGAEWKQLSLEGPPG